MTHFSQPATEFGLTVGGVGLQIGLPDATWAADLAPMYAEFPLSGAPSWHIAVQHDPQLPAAQPRWITHEGDITHFHIDHFAGWVNLQEKTVAIRTSALQHGPSAVERAAGYACMHSLLREHDSVLLHAAGIHWRGHGLVVSGHSGSGKSTLARLALSQGEPVNDEMIIVDLSSTPPDPAQHPLSQPRHAARDAPPYQSRLSRDDPVTTGPCSRFSPDPAGASRGRAGVAAHQHRCRRAFFQRDRLDGDD